MKESQKKILAFILVVLVPIIPVIILYVLFDKYNYFELEDNIKGILAGGPIAAYFALLAATWKIYQKISPGQFLSKELEFLIGDWTVTSISKKSNTQYSGKIKITEQGSTVTFGGPFTKDEELVAQISTLIAKIEDSSIIHLVYIMNDQRRGNQSITGYSRLNITSKEKLEGSWSVVGSEEYGIIEYVKGQ